MNGRSSEAGWRFGVRRTASVGDGGSPSECAVASAAGAAPRAGNPAWNRHC
ncbi:hypothetical protein F750_0507 [Streptomyces sp. PAMC 26508]|nr:hypothetical protein F750_0507 [Streptomyces sp. PAMC 26508]